MALYRSRGEGAAEIVPSRIDLFDYPGGYGWGYGGSGALNLSYAIAGKIFERDHLSNGELAERGRALLDHVISKLDGESEHDVPVATLKQLFS